ncbi:hypothetical protein ACFFSY_29255 [Paenibacillus aurantiacus]|uniref:MerR family transcriptional regulator n=1 Tax=Paenibacillus aurantiacus TaxID=1936118 RepID=A0ABV5KXV2_9BACL
MHEPAINTTQLRDYVENGKPVGSETSRRWLRYLLGKLDDLQVMYDALLATHDGTQLLLEEVQERSMKRRHELSDIKQRLEEAERLKRAYRDDRDMLLTVLKDIEEFTAEDDVLKWMRSVMAKVEGRDRCACCTRPKEG